MSMISVNRLNFEYDGKKALQDVSFSIEDGSVTALVGPNGAGKTTLLRCLVGLEKPLSGDITVNGLNVGEDPRQAHRLCGYLSDFFGLYDALTVRQSLTYMAWCQNVPENVIEERIAEVANVLALEKNLDVENGALSRGNRQRVGIGLALIHNPKILVLDEPASGMDPEARARLSHLMLDLKSRGKTIIVSSHILNELEDYCTDMLVIHDGKVSDHIALKTYKKDELAKIRIVLSGAPFAHFEAIKSKTGITGAEIEENAILCNFSGDPEKQRLLLKDLVEGGVPVCGFTVIDKRLQDAYMDISEGKKG